MAWIVVQGPCLCLLAAPALTPTAETARHGTHGCTGEAGGAVCAAISPQVASLCLLSLWFLSQTYWSAVPALMGGGAALVCRKTFTMQNPTQVMLPSLTPSSRTLYLRSGCALPIQRARTLIFQCV